MVPTGRGTDVDEVEEPANHIRITAREHEVEEISVEMVRWSLHVLSRSTVRSSFKQLTAAS